MTIVHEGIDTIQAIRAGIAPKEAEIEVKAMEKIQENLTDSQQEVEATADQAADMIQRAGLFLPVHLAAKGSEEEAVEEAEEVVEVAGAAKEKARSVLNTSIK